MADLTGDAMEVEGAPPPVGGDVAALGAFISKLQRTHARLRGLKELRGGGGDAEADAKATRLGKKVRAEMDEQTRYIDSGGSVGGAYKHVWTLVAAALPPPLSKRAQAIVQEDTAATQGGAKGPVEAALDSVVLAGIRLFHSLLRSAQFSAVEAREVLTESVIRRWIMLLVMPSLPSADPGDLSAIPTRTLLRSIVHRLYRNMKKERKFMLQAFKTLIVRISAQLSETVGVYSDEGAFAGVNELLAIVASIIQGFKEPLTAKHKSLLHDAILPMHQPSGNESEMVTLLSLFHKPLSLCVLSFLRKDRALCVDVIKYFISNWCHHSAKQGTLILNELQEVLELASDTERRTVHSELLSFLDAHCLNNLNCFIAQRALLLLHSDPGKALLAVDVATSIKRLRRSLITTAQEHWNSTTKQMAYKLVQYLGDRDEALSNVAAVQALRSEFEEFERQEAEYEAAKYAGMSVKKPELDAKDFARVRELAKGSYATVDLCIRFNFGVPQQYWEEYAIKKMDKELLAHQNYEENVKRELQLLESFDHPHIAALIARYDSDTHLYAVMEYCDQGDVFSLLSRLGSVDVEWARFAVAEVALALEYMHSRKVVHNDIKPENILIHRSGHVKVCDLGSVVLQTQDGQACDGDVKLEGTAEYLDPRVIGGEKPSPSSDWYALGCVLYQLLCGSPPFTADTQEELFEKIKTANVQDLPYPEGVDNAAKEVITKLLDRNSGDGVTSLADIRDMPFFAPIDFDALSTSPAVKASGGSVAAVQVDVKLRQRRYSMLVTKSLPQKYQYQTDGLEVIIEDDGEDDM